MTLPLLLGEIPSYSGRRYCAFPLSGAIGKRLCEFAGIQPDEEGSKYGKWYWALQEHFGCANAIPKYQPQWDAEKAYRRVRELLLEEPPPAVVALGRRAAAAVGIPASAPWGEWQKHFYSGLEFLCDVTVIPHPSGRNRLYNDPAMRETAGRVLREAMAIHTLERGGDDGDND